MPKTTKKKASSRSSANKKASSTKKAATSRTSSNKTKATAKKASAKATTKKSATKKKASSKKKATLKETKATTKKSTTKKASAKTTASSKKSSSKKATTKKVSAKKVSAKTSTKKSTTKKTSAKASAKKAAAKTSSTKKASANKAAPTKASQTSTKKNTTKKSTTKASTKKAATKKASAKKSTIKKASEKKATTKPSVKKAAAKKTASKSKAKASTKKAATKKASVKTSTKKAPPKTKTSTSKAKASTAKVHKPKANKKSAKRRNSNKAHKAAKSNKSLGFADTPLEKGSDLVETYSRMFGPRSQKKPSQQRRAEAQKKQETRQAPPRPSTMPRTQATQHRGQTAGADGKIVVKIFHPDADAGGRYIDVRVFPDQIPPGAIVPESQPSDGRPDARQAGDHQQRRQYRARQPQDPMQGPPVPGGILAAGRRLKATGGSAPNPRPTTPPAASSSTPAKAAKPQAPVSSETTSPAMTPQARARQGLEALFSKGSAAKTPVIPNDTPNKGPSTTQQTSAARPQLPRYAPQPPKSQASAPPVSAAFQQGLRGARPTQPPRQGAPKTRERVVIDGRVVEAPGSQQAQQARFAQVQRLRSPDRKLLLFRLLFQKGTQAPLDAHLMLWPEGEFLPKVFVNDANPRPRVWAEEGLEGLGVEERRSELQRWSMRDWWDQLSKKQEHPVAAFALNRVVHDRQPVTLIHDKEYNVYRSYQASGETLQGKHPMVFFERGYMYGSSVTLDGLKEKERLTPERVHELLVGQLPQTHFDVGFSAIPLIQRGTPVDMTTPESLSLFNDQLAQMFQFPALELPDPLGGTGSVRLHLGQWEMSQDLPGAQQLRQQALHAQAVKLQASPGYLSDLVRRELWRKDPKLAESWTGYTPIQIEDAIRVALRENHYNMQGFQPKKPGDYHYDPKTGIFQIVLRRKPMTHTLLLQGQTHTRRILGALVLYGKEGKEGFDPFTDYLPMLQSQEWKAMLPTLRWRQAWLTASGTEGRCLWSDPDHLPTAPAIRRMPDWSKGVSQAMYLVPSPS